MAFRFSPDNVRKILDTLLDDIGYWEPTGTEAEKQLCYIAGMKDMSNAVIKALNDLGGGDGK